MAVGEVYAFEGLAGLQSHLPVLYGHQMQNMAIEVKGAQAAAPVGGVQMQRRKPANRPQSGVLGTSWPSWMALVAIVLLWSNVRNYREFTKTVPNADSIAEAATWEAGYAHWLDTVEGGQWAEKGRRLS